jgi:hypothetical protein
MLLNYVYCPRLKSPDHCRSADVNFGYLYIMSQREMSISNAVEKAVYSETMFQMTTIKTQEKIAKREENKSKIIRTSEWNKSLCPGSIQEVNLWVKVLLLRNIWNGMKINSFLPTSHIHKSKILWHDHQFSCYVSNDAWIYLITCNFRLVPQNTPWNEIIGTLWFTLSFEASMLLLQTYDALCKVEKQVHNVWDLRFYMAVKICIVIFWFTRIHGVIIKRVTMNTQMVIQDTRYFKMFRVCKGLVWRHRPPFVSDYFE